MTTTVTNATGTLCLPGFCSGNASASKKFYTSLLGWEAKDSKSPGGEYTMFKLKGQDVAGMYQMPDERKKAGVAPHWNTYIAVDDIEEVVKKTAAKGGKVLKAPFDAMGDLMANLEDPMGAKFSVWQARKNPDHSTLLREVGSLCWIELYTTDTAKASAFYTELFGWKAEPFEGGPMPYTTFTPQSTGQGVGGMLKITDDMKGMKPQWIPYFNVEDADKVATNARKLGAEIKGPFDIPKVGRIAIIKDPEQAHLGIIKMQCEDKAKS